MEFMTTTEPAEKETSPEEYASSLLGLLVFGLIYLCVKCKAHRLFTTSGCYSCRHECDVPDAFRNASSRNADCCRESRRPCSRWFSRVPRRYTTESQTDNGELPRDMFPDLNVVATGSNQEAAVALFNESHDYGPISEHITARNLFIAEPSAPLQDDIDEDTDMTSYPSVPPPAYSQAIGPSLSGVIDRASTSTSPPGIASINDPSRTWNRQTSLPPTYDEATESLQPADEPIGTYTPILSDPVFQGGLHEPPPNTLAPPSYESLGRDA